MIEIVAPSRLAPHLVSPAVLAGELGLAVDDPDLVPLLDTVARAFASPEGLGRPLPLMTYREIRFGSGLAALSLSAYPLVELLEVSASELEIELDQFTFDTGSGLTRFRLRRVGAVCWGYGDEYRLTYRAGWVLPGWLVTWSAGATVAAGSWLRPVVGQLCMLEAAIGGVSGSVEPSWSFEEGSETIDGTVRWIALRAEVVPADVQRLVPIAAQQVIDSADLPEGISSDRVGPVETSYHFSLSEGRLLSVGLPAAAKRVLRRYQ